MRNRFQRFIRRSAADERGSMPVVAAIFAIAFVAATVVVINQHQNLDALSAARETSFNAARAANQKLDEDQQRLTKSLVVDERSAHQAASGIVSEVRNATLQSMDVNGSEVVVVVTVRSEAILGARTFTSTGRAQAIDPSE